MRRKYKPFELVMIRGTSWQEHDNRPAIVIDEELPCKDVGDAIYRVLIGEKLTTYSACYLFKFTGEGDDEQA
jgi:hypothetical protein